MIWGAARRRARIEAAVAAYTQWRSEGDREERAATTYASLMSRVGHLAETGLAHQLARMKALPGSVVAR
jgi:hypothetical protein